MTTESAARSPRSARRPRRSVRVDCSHLENKRMNGDVYAERRVAMAIVYRARELARSVGFDFPRVSVRICEDHASILGVAKMGKAEIFITSRSLAKSPAATTHVVLHEILHAVIALPHVPGCHLMDPYAPKSPDVAKLEALFVEYLRAN